MQLDHLPCDVDVERHFLGSILFDSTYLDSVRNSITPEEFSLDKHARIWKHVCTLYDKGESPDTTTVFSSLAATKEAEACGGLGGLVDLTNGIPSTPSLDGYIRILKDKSLRRRMIHSAQYLMNRAMVEAEPIDDVLAGFGDTVANLAAGQDDSKPISTADLVEKVGVDALLSPRRHGEIRLPWPSVDRPLCGFSGGQVIVLLGETSRGKTSFALQVATHAGMQGKAVLIWTMEMSPRSLFRRMVTQLSNVPVGGKPAAQLSFDERDAHRMAVAHLTENPIYFDHNSRSVSAFCSNARQVRSRSKSKLGLVVVDYLQLIRSNSRQTRAQQVSENSRNLKLAAMDFNVPFLVLSQVDRASVKKDGEIGLHSAKESGDIENDADVLLWLKSKELSRDAPTSVGLMVGKQREGAAGFMIPMEFRPTSQTFQEE